MASTLATYYNASQTNDWQVHGVCDDGTYMYMVCFNIALAGTECYIVKVDSSMVVQGKSKLTPTNYGAFQGITCDGTNLYLSYVTATKAFGLYVTNGTYVLKVACSQIGNGSPSVAYTVKTHDGTFSCQGVFLGNDANSTASVYQVSSYPTSNYGYITKLAQSNLGFTAGYAKWYIQNIQTIFSGLVNSSQSNNIYICGSGISSSNVVGYFARLRQEQSGGNAIVSGTDSGSGNTDASRLLIYTGDESTYLGTGSNLAAMQIDPSSGDYIWAVGWIPKASGSDNGDVLLVKIAINATNLSVSNAWRLHHSTQTSFRGQGIFVDANYIYISTGILPHQQLGTSEYSLATHNASFVRLNRTSLEALSASSLISNLSADSLVRTIKNGAGSGRSTSWSLSSYNSDTTNLYIPLAQDIEGDEVYLSASILKIPRALSASTGTLYDTEASISEISDSANVTITKFNINGASPNLTVVESTPVVAVALDPANDTLTLADGSNSSMVTTIDQTSFIELITPTGESSLGLKITAGAVSHLQCLTDELDDSSSVVYKDATTWAGDLMSHSFSDTPAGRFTKVEALVRGKVNTGTASTRIAVTWKIGAGTQRYMYHTASETTAFTDFWYDITTQTGAPSTWSDIHNMTFGPYIMAGSVVNWTQASETRLRVTWTPFINTNITYTGGLLVNPYSGAINVRGANITNTGTITVPTMQVVYPVYAVSLSGQAIITVPTITQIYAAAPANVSATGIISVPALSQLHNAAPANISATATVSTPSQIQAYTMAPAIVTATAAVTLPAVSQLYTVAPANCSARTYMPVPTMSVLYMLTPAAVQSAPAAINAPAITQVYKINPAGITRYATASMAALTASAVVAPASMSATASLTAPTLDQIYNIQVDNVGAMATLSPAAASSEGAMSPMPVQASKIITVPDVTQAHILAPANVSATAALSVAAITQIYSLAGAGVTAMAVLSDALLTESASAVISPANISRNATVTLPALTQAHSLAVSGVSVGKTITAVNIAEIGADILNVSSVTGTASLSAATLTQVHSIQTANVTATGQVTVTVLAQGHVIACADLTATSAASVADVVYDIALSISGVVATAGVSDATLVIDAWEQTVVIDGLTRNAALSIASILQTHSITPDNITGSASVGTAAIGSIGRIFKPQMKSLSHKRYTIEKR